MNALVSLNSCSSPFRTSWSWEGVHQTTWEKECKSALTRQKPQWSKATTPYRSQKEFTDWHVENSHWFAKNFQYIFLTIPNLATQSRGKWSFLCMVLFFPLCFPGYPAVTNTSSHLILVKLKKKKPNTLPPLYIWLLLSFQKTFSKNLSISM